MSMKIGVNSVSKVKSLEAETHRKGSRQFGVKQAMQTEAT